MYNLYTERVTMETEAGSDLPEATEMPLSKIPDNYNPPSYKQHTTHLLTVEISSCKQHVLLLHLHNQLEMSVK